MQAVILAAGQSSRFHPLSKGIHKSMIKLCGKPILEYVILGIKNLGIKEIIIVTENSDIIPSYFGNGDKFGISIAYVVQQKAIGAGNGLLEAEKHIKGDFLLLNGYHLDVEELGKKLIEGKNQSDAALLIKEKNEIWDKGVVRFVDNRLEELIEKPEKGHEDSKFYVIGIYLFSKDFIKSLNETPYEHYQLERAISLFAKDHFVRVVKTKSETISLKYPWDILSVKNYLFNLMKKRISKNVNIAKSSEIIGDVIIEEGVTVMEGAKIKGPCYIGKNSYIGNNVILRNGVDIGEDCVIGANMEIKNTIIMANSKTHSGFIGDSVVGENSRIGTQFCTANVRLDRDTVKALVKDKKIDTGLKYLGFFSGRNVHIGVKSSTMPGVLIGENAVIGPSTTVFDNVLDNMKYYSKFQEIVKK